VKTSKPVAVRPATAKEQHYVDRAAYYVGRAMLCYQAELWPEAATNFGSALESLLRVRFGAGGTLANLVDKFDRDSYFNGILVHDGASKNCATCMADEIRRLRNAVHPDCWKEAAKKEVDRAGMLVLMLYHVLVTCDQSKVGIFQASPDVILRNMEAAGISFESTEQAVPVPR